jgi:hypothetical protein
MNLFGRAAWKRMAPLPPTRGRALFEPARKFLLLENHVNRFDDSNLWICFAIYNHFMLKLLRSGDIEEMLLCQTVVPATVPSGESICIPLPRSRKRGTGQRLYVNISFRISVRREVSLCSSARTRRHKKCCCKHQHFPHLSLLCQASMKMLTLRPVSSDCRTHAMQFRRTGASGRWHNPVLAVRQHRQCSISPADGYDWDGLPERPQH